MIDGSDKSALDNIIYVSIPDNIDILEDLPIDPSILMPVEPPPGTSDFSIHELSWEMIIAAMLRILAYNPDHEHADYYRTVITAVKPDIKSELLEAGVIKARNKDFDIAEEIFLSLTHLFQDDLPAAVNLALVYEEHGEVYEKIGKDHLADRCYEQAFEAHKKALMLDPESPDAHLNAGTFYLKRRNFNKALVHLEAFIGLSDDPKRNKKVTDMIQRLKNRSHYDVLFSEAFDFIKMGKEEEGIARISEFLKTNPEVWNAWFLLGWAHRRLGNYKEGRDAFYKAIEHGSVEADTHNELAICLLELGHYAESRKELEKALRMDPENTKIINNLGILSLKQEEPEQAAGFFRTVLDIDPEDEIARQYIDYMDS